MKNLRQNPLFVPKPFICIVLLLILGCMTQRPLSVPQKAKKKLALGGKRISMQELTSEASSGHSQVGVLPRSLSFSARALLETRNKGIRSETPAAASFPPQVPGSAILALPPPSSATPKDCALALERVITRYKALSQVLPPETLLLQKTPLENMLLADPTACNSDESRIKILRYMNFALNSHSQRIGLILPLTGRLAAQSAQILNGMRAAFTELGVDFDKYVLLRDSGNTAKEAEARFAELVLKHQVKMISGGLDRSEAEVLAQWSSSLGFPTILLSPNQDLAALSNATFVLYPNQKRLAETLVRAALEKDKKRIAILRPTSGRADQLIAYFKEALTARGGKVTAEVNYTAGQFESMQNATKKLFMIDVPERAEELKAAYLKAKQSAEEEHRPFNAKEVLLPPIVEFDALLLPDDFRSVRHFTKLFKFHMVEKLTLIGNHEWRSIGLIDPPDDYLTGSFFADFVGSYQDLPSSLQIGKNASPWFIDPDLVTTVDYRLIGYRTAKVLTGILNKATPKRKQVASHLASLAIQESKNSALLPVFDQGRMAKWPTYIFTVQKDQLSMTQDFQRRR